jgi:hypothetical protein
LLDNKKNNKKITPFYRRKKNESDFEEGGDSEMEFTPDRQPSFHLDYDNIILNNGSSVYKNPIRGKEKKKEYTLEYDKNLTQERNLIPLLTKLQERLKIEGLYPKTVTENDKVFRKNLTKNLKKTIKDDAQKDEGTEEERIVFFI